MKLAKNILISIFAIMAILISVISIKDRVYYGYKSKDYEDTYVFVIPSDVVPTLSSLPDVDIESYEIYHEDNYEVVLNRNNKIASFASYCEPIGCVSWELYNQNGFYYLILKYLEDD